MGEEEKIKEMDVLFLSSSRGKIYSTVIRDTERLLIRKALDRAFGNQSIAAKLLGINRNTLRAKIKRLNITAREFKL